MTIRSFVWYCHESFNKVNMKILRYHCMYSFLDNSSILEFLHMNIWIFLNIKEALSIPNIESHHSFVFHVYFKQWIKDKKLYLKYIHMKVEWIGEINAWLMIRDPFTLFNHDPVIIDKKRDFDGRIVNVGQLSVCKNMCSYNLSFLLITS